MSDLLSYWKWVDSLFYADNKRWPNRIIVAVKEQDKDAALYAVDKWRKSYSVEVINGSLDFSITFYFKSVKECEAFASVIPHPWLVIRGKH